VLLMRTPILASVLLFTAAVMQAQQPEWSVPFGSFSQHAGLDVTRDGAAILAYTSVPCEKIASLKGEQGLMNRLAVAKVDRSGQTIFDVAIPRPDDMQDARLGPSMGIVGGVAALDGGDFAVFVEFREGYPWMLRYDGEGKAVFRKPLSREGRHSITSVARAGDDLVVAGQAEGDFYAAKYAANGRRIWEQVIDGGDIDVIMALAVDSDGNVVATGMSLPADLERAMKGDSSVAVYRFDAEGNAVAETHFPGRFPSVAVSRSAIAVVYDRGAALNVSVRLKTFTRALAETSEQPLAAAAGPQASVTSTPDGRFIIAALGETKPVLIEVSETGARRAEINAALPHAATYRLVHDGRALYAAADEIGVREEDRTCIRARLTRVAVAR
jgi:hypothetical protein